jgi:acetyl esterase
MVYFHAGGGYAGSPELASPVVNRYAVEGDVDVVSVKYRLAPEAKAPSGVYDAYAATKWVIQNAESLGINAKKIGIFGDEAGAMIAAGVGMMLAEKGESHLVRF